MPTMKKKTKNKKVNVTQTVVVNVGKGRRNVKPKVQAPLVQAPIVSQQVASQALGISPALNYHQMVYGNLPVPYGRGSAEAVPQMANVPGSYYGMISPFNKPLHVVSEVQQAQLRQANELAGQNVIVGGKGYSLQPNGKGFGESEPLRGEQIKDSLGNRSLNPALSLGKQEAQSVSFKQHAEEPMKQPMSPFGRGSAEAEPRVNAEAAPYGRGSAEAVPSSSQQNLIDALAVIESSSGVRGNEKPIQGQMTKNQLITMVKNVSGQAFSPSASADYSRIKRSAITFITDILKKRSQ